MYNCFQVTLSLQIFSVKMMHAFIIFSTTDSHVKVLQSRTTHGQTHLIAKSSQTKKQSQLCILKS